MIHLKYNVANLMTHVKLTVDNVPTDPILTTIGHICLEIESMCVFSCVLSFLTTHQCTCNDLVHKHILNVIAGTLDDTPTHHTHNIFSEKYNTCLA